MSRRFRTVRELICWEYAKLVTDCAVGDRTAYRFVQHTYLQLLAGERHPTSIIRENQLQHKDGERCAYCGCQQGLEWDHVIPLARGGPDSYDNLVRACGPCNRAKGARDPYRWQADGHEGDIPRIVLGKLLKLCMDAYNTAKLLDDAPFMTRQAITRASLCSVFDDERSRRDDGA